MSFKDSVYSTYKVVASDADSKLDILIKHNLEEMEKEVGAMEKAEQPKPDPKGATFRNPLGDMKPEQYKKEIKKRAQQHKEMFLLQDKFLKEAKKQGNSEALIDFITFALKAPQDKQIEKFESLPDDLRKSLKSHDLMTPFGVDGLLYKWAHALK